MTQVIFFLSRYIPKKFEILLTKKKSCASIVIAVVQSLSHIQLFMTPWTAAWQASLSFTSFQSLLKLTCIQSVMSFNNLILCCPLLLPSIFPSIKVFSNDLALCIRWPKYWHFSWSISPSKHIENWFHWFGSPCSPWESKESSPTPQFKSINSLCSAFFMVQLS